MPLHAMRRAAGGSGSNVTITVGAGDTATNNDTFTFTNLALNGTAAAGDLIVACIMGGDGGNSDSSFGISVTGFSAVATRFTQQSTLGNTSLATCVLQQVASGGETTVTVSGSWTSFGGTMDQTSVKVFLVSGLSSTTAIDTATGGSASVTLDTTGAGIVIGCGSRARNGTGGGNFTGGFMDGGDDYNYAYDDAPLGGATDSYDMSTAAVELLQSQAMASWG